MSPLTVPFITMLVTSTRPSMKPVSLTDRAPPFGAVLRTLPFTLPSRCRPPEKSRSPLRFAVLPSRVSMRMDACLRRPNIATPAPRSLRIDTPHVRLLHRGRAAPVGSDLDQQLFGFHARRHGDLLFDVLEIAEREGYLTPFISRECREIHTSRFAIKLTVDGQDDDTADHRVRLHGLDQCHAD